MILTDTGTAALYSFVVRLLSLLVAICFVCLVWGVGGRGVSFAGHRWFQKASIHCFTQFNQIVIPEPQTGFHIAFKMLDIDGNEHVDKKEFQKVWHVFSHIIWHHVF